MQFFDMFFGSFHSAALYARLRREGHYAFAYSFLLVALCTLLLVAALGLMLHQVVFSAKGEKPPLFDTAVTQIAQQLPTMSWHHEHLQADVPGPKVIRLTLDIAGKPTVVDVITIDTSGATTADNAKTPLLIDSTNIHVRSSRKTDIHPLAKLAPDMPDTLIINRALIDETATAIIARVHASLNKFYLLLGALSWLALTLYFYIARIVTLFILAGVANLIGKSRGIALPMPQAMAMAAVSFTPVAVASTLAIMLSGHAVGGPLLLLGGALTFWTALRASRRIRMDF